MKKIAIVFTLLITSSLVWYFMNQEKPAAAVKAVATADGKMSELSVALAKNNLPYQRWEVPDFGRFLLPSGLFREDISRWVINNFNLLTQRLAGYSKISETAGLSDLLKGSAVGAVSFGEYANLKVTFLFEGNPNATPEEIKKSLKVVYFGDLQRDKVIRGKGESAAEYISEIDALLIPCLVFENPVVRDAIVFHELKHAQQDRQAKMFGVRPNLKVNGRISDALANDEVNAYKLSGDILDVGTNGEFYKRIRNVVTKRKVDDAEKFFLSLEAADVVQVEEVLGKAGSLEGAARRTMIYMSLVSEWVNQNIPLESRQAAKREFYFKTIGSHQ